MKMFTLMSQAWYKWCSYRYDDSSDSTHMATGFKCKKSCCFKNPVTGLVRQEQLWFAAFHKGCARPSWEGIEGFAQTALALSCLSVSLLHMPNSSQAEPVCADAGEHWWTCWDLWEINGFHFLKISHLARKENRTCSYTPLSPGESLQPTKKQDMLCAKKPERSV